MIRGSTYSAVMHLSILAAILFGLPSLTFVLPDLKTEEPPLRVVVMTEKDAEGLNRTTDAPARDAPGKTARAENESRQVRQTPDRDRQYSATDGSPSSPRKEEGQKPATAQRPEPRPTPGGGASVVTTSDPQSDGRNETSTTTKQFETPEEGTPAPGAAQDNLLTDATSAADKRVAGGARSATAQDMPRKETNPTRFSFVPRPVSDPSTAQPATQGSAQSQAQSQPLGASASTQATPNRLSVNSMPEDPSGVTKMIPDAREAGETTPQEAISSSALQENETVAQIVAELAQKIPRLQALREHLDNPEADRTNPAIAQSAQRMEKRSDEGYTHAQFSLAEMYLTGDGVRKDPAKAAALLKRAAIGGYLPAQLTMAMLAAEGRGMERNLAEAHTWLAVAAEQGNKAAKDALPKLEKRMTTKDAVEARKQSLQLHQVLVIIHGRELSKASKSELSERLRIAATLGDVESVHVLLAQGADADNPDLDGRTAVIEAAWRGYPRIIKSLIDNGAKLSATDHTGKNALMWAAINGHAPVIKSLLAAGAPLNDQDNEGISALMRAAWNGHMDTVKVLLEAKADPSLRDKKGLRAIGYARKSKNSKLVQLLAAAHP